MKSMLFLTPELPYPPFSGGRIKSWKMVEFFGNNYDLSVGCILKGNDQEYFDEFKSKAKLHDFFSHPVNVPRTTSNLIKSYLKNIPLNVYRTYSKKFAEAVQKKASKYDIIFVDHYEVFQYVPDDYRGLLVLHEHNAYYYMFQCYARETKNFPKRIVSYLESIRVKKSEALCCKRSDLIFASPNDIENLTKIGVDRSKCRITYHLGDDSQLNLPSLRFENTEKALLYVGTLGWEANIDGLLWFIKEMWPTLKKEHLDLKLYIIGKNPDERLTNAANGENDIIFTGFVEDLEEYFQRCRIFIAPLRFGSGIKVKVLNAMSRGLPTVTTSTGTEGLMAENMEHIAIANSKEQMITAINRLLVDSKIWKNMEQNSRALIAKHYTWDKLFKSMEKELEKSFEKS